MTITDHRIGSINNLVAPPHVVEKAVNEEISRVIGNQTPQVVLISGATVTCKASLKAVENAV